MTGDPTKRRAKRVLAIVVVALAAATATSFLGTAGALLASLQQVRGLDPANPVDDLGTEPPPFVIAADATVLWPVDASVLDRVGVSYTRAWQRIAASLAACRDEGLDTALADGALNHARTLVTDVRSAGCGTVREASDHHLSLRFVAADGSLLVVADDRFLLTDRITGPDGRPTVIVSRASLVATLSLDDGDWRVHDLAMTTIEAAASPAP